MTSVVAFCRWQKQPRAIAVSTALDRLTALTVYTVYERARNLIHARTHGAPRPSAGSPPRRVADSEPPTGQSSQKSATGSAARKEPLTRCNAPPTTIITWCARYRLNTGYREFLPTSSREPVAASARYQSRVHRLLVGQLPALFHQQQYVTSRCSLCGCTTCEHRLDDIN